MPGSAVELAAAGDQSECRAVRVAVDELGGECRFVVPADIGDREDGNGAVGAFDAYGVASLQAAEPVEDGRAVGCESTWPAITAGPSAPGVGEYLYQPALLYVGPGGGTSSAPVAVRPSCSSPDFTLIAGIVMEIGVDGGNTGRGSWLRPA